MNAEKLGGLQRLLCRQQGSAGEIRPAVRRRLRILPGLNSQPVAYQMAGCVIDDSRWMAQCPEWQECVDAQGGMDGMPNVINLMEEDAATEGRFLSGQAGSHSQGTSWMMLLTRSSHLNVPISLSYLVQRPGEKHLELHNSTKSTVNLLFDYEQLSDVCYLEVCVCALKQLKDKHAADADDSGRVEQRIGGDSLFFFRNGTWSEILNMQDLRACAAQVI